MKTKANIFANLYKLSGEIRKIVELELEKRGFDISYNHHDDAHLNVVIGGDGTFIKAVHDSGFSDIPFLGINTGHLGFYNDINPDEVRYSLDKIFNGEYTKHDLKLIECIVHTDDGEYSYKSLNEIVLKAKYASIIRFDLVVDDVKIQSFAGDGIIFSTPSGSTAYNLSAGGAIMYHDIEAFQITPLAPIRSALHRSLDKSLVVPKDTVIKLKTKRTSQEGYSLSIDGMMQEHENIDYIEIKLSDTTINKLVLDKNWFWKNIRDKFI